MKMQKDTALVLIYNKIYNKFLKKRYRNGPKGAFFTRFRT